MSKSITISTEYKDNITDRAVTFTLIFLENIKNFELISNERVIKKGQIAQSAIGGAKTASKSIPFSALVVYPAAQLFDYLSAKEYKADAIKKLWFLDNSPTNRKELRQKIIESAVKIFISFEVPCSLFGQQFTEVVAKDAVHRVFHYLASQYQHIQDFDPDLIIKGVLYGGSKKDGILAKVPIQKPGFNVGEYNTRKVFTKPGIIYDNKIMLKPKNDVYGYRLKFECEEIVCSNYGSSVLDNETFPKTRFWDESTKNLISEICDRVEKLIESEQTELVEKLNQILKTYFDEVNTGIADISGKLDSTKEIILEGHSEILKNQAGTSESISEVLDRVERLREQLTDIISSKPDTVQDAVAESNHKLADSDTRNSDTLAAVSSKAADKDPEPDIPAKKLAELLVDYELKKAELPAMKVDEDGDVPFKEVKRASEKLLKAEVKKSIERPLRKLWKRKQN